MKDKQRSTSQVEDKHTPGPWKATKFSSIEYNERSIMNEDQSIQALSARFKMWRDTPSRLNRYMDRITQVALQCDTVLEIGIGKAEGMLACLNAMPKLYVGCTEKITPGVLEVGQLAGNLEIGIVIREEVGNLVLLEGEFGTFDMMLLDGDMLNRGFRLDQVGIVNKHLVVHNSIDYKLNFPGFRLAEERANYQHWIRKF